MSDQESSEAVLLTKIAKELMNNDKSPELASLGYLIVRVMESYCREILGFRSELDQRQAEQADIKKRIAALEKR